MHIRPLTRILAIVAATGLSYVAVYLWEEHSTPYVHPGGNSWRGVTLSLCCFPAASLLMSRVYARPAYYFLFGAIGATFLYPRFLCSGTFHWWAHNTFRDSTMNISIVIFILGLGTTCAVAARIGSHRSQPSPGNSKQFRLMAAAWYFFVLALSLACFRAAVVVDHELGELLTTYGIVIMAGALGAALGQAIGGTRPALAGAGILGCCGIAFSAAVRHNVVL